MAWETPDTFVEGQLVPTEALQKISDNLNALKAPPANQAILDDTANYTTAGTSFADINTSLNVQIVTAGSVAVVSFFSSVSMNVAGGNAVYFDIELETNGTVVGRLGGDDGMLALTSVATNAVMLAAIQWRATGLLAGGTHVFTPQWKVTGGTATCYAGNGTGTDLHGQLWAAEIT